MENKKKGLSIIILSIGFILIVVGVFMANIIQDNLQNENKSQNQEQEKITTKEMALQIILENNPEKKRK